MRTASGWSRASSTAWPCRSRACRSIGPQRVLIFDDEDLGWRRAQRRRRSAQPAGRNSGLARLLFDVGDLLLAFSMSPLRTRSSSASAFWRSSAIWERSIGVVAGGEIGGQRVDTALEGFGEDFVAPEIVAGLRNPAAPGGLILGVRCVRLLLGRAGRRRLPSFCASAAGAESVGLPCAASVAGRASAGGGALGSPPFFRSSLV